MNPVESTTAFDRESFRFIFYFNRLRNVYRMGETIEGLHWRTLIFDIDDQADVDVCVSRGATPLGTCLENDKFQLIYLPAGSDDLVVDASPEAIGVYLEAKDWLREKEALIEEMRQGLPVMPMSE